MRYCAILLVLISLSLYLAACNAPASVSPATTPSPTPTPTPARIDILDQDHPLILAHFMTWYQAPPRKGWGAHWTGYGALMPGRIDENGQHEIASHVYPLTGPYDSRDADILEYQVLLMKITGIDGVIVDWYGHKHIYDYGDIHKATVALFGVIENAGMTFTVCYEDRTLSAMTEGGILKGDAIVQHSIDVMQFLEQTWFDSERWPHTDNRPLLFIFGPIYHTDPADWDMIFSDLTERPFFITLDNKVPSAADAAYPWIPMHTEEAGVVSPARWQAYLDAFYKRTEGDALRVGAAFPQFHDIYAEIGTEQSYGYLDPQNGETFRTSLQMAVDAEVDIIQLITWNDYGEGTVIEPTVEFGYTYLEAIQSQQIEWQGTVFPYTGDDLRLPLRILELRRAGSDDAILDAVSQAILNGDPKRAHDLLEGLK